MTDSAIPALSSDPHNPPRAPRGLRGKGKAYWTSVVSRYSLRVDEVILLEQMCRTLDQIDKLQAALEAAPLTVLGSMKQEVSHPLISELRMLRQSWASMAKQLALPDETPVGATLETEQKSQRHQRAARARWAQLAAKREAQSNLAEERAR